MASGVVSLRAVLRLRLSFGLYSHLSPRPALRAAAALYCIVLLAIINTILLNIIVKFATSFAFFVIKGCEIVSKIKDTERSGSLDGLIVMECTMFCLQFAVVSLPAIFTEMIHVEEEKLKALIAEHLSDREEAQRSGGNSVSAALILGAEYLDQRPFRICLWNSLPLDASLVLTFAGLCVSYLIVVVQIFDLV
ncbi:uncharacterized protein LOC125234238 [Leguminivora glycinivorella]|uniref:uncharacterized protein LOC125234238 n=1 Tax=Leguminivora glycinivorella TaxID=1035111 RepID=UPI00200C01AD|nr:uncharacterized protein LOC125234238 [Leguminivora glycinivorella]